ncbi:hypothetical protein ACO2Q2_04810 [Dyella sp. KRB-257]
MFVLYQSAEGVGGRWLHSFAVHLLLVVLLFGVPASRRPAATDAR